MLKDQVLTLFDFLYANGIDLGASKCADEYAYLPLGKALRAVQFQAPKGFDLSSLPNEKRLIGGKLLTAVSISGFLLAICPYSQIPWIQAVGLGCLNAFVTTGHQRGHAAVDDPPRTAEGIMDAIEWVST